MGRSRLLFGLLFLSMLLVKARAEEACPGLNVPQVVPGTNMFSAVQEVDLGDAIAEKIRQSELVIQDPDVTTHMQQIVDRLQQPLPKGGTHFRVMLVDLPTANAFSIVGGRIYVGRKMVALTRSEDELAGVLAHEMGHIVAHHEAIVLSESFRRLGIKQVGDRDDVFAKWNEFVSNYRRHPAAMDRDKALRLEEREQMQADNIALYLMARAGYSMPAFGDIFDRLAETKGKTGGFWSDLFGTTTQDSKRLRELIKSKTPMPPGCVLPNTDVEVNFTAWKNSVLDYVGIGHKEILPGLVSKRILTERLRPEISNIRISPDGRYVLAQDDGNIFVLTREPMKSVFRIEAVDADPAQFTPDSRGIVFEVAGFGVAPRVERWDLVSQKRQQLSEIHVLQGCLTSAVSPDGNTATCVTMDVDSGFILFKLALYDTISGGVYWEKKDWLRIQPSFDLAIRIFQALNQKRRRVFDGAAMVSFSPDGHYLVAHSPANDLCMDLRNHRTIELPGHIKGLLEHSFTFVGSDHLFGVAGARGDKSELVEFPSGRVVYKDIMAGTSFVSPVARGSYVVVRPLKNNPLGILDLKQNKFVLASKRTALDLWDEKFIAERGDGDLQMFDLGGVTPVAEAQLPEAPLGAIHAGAVSGDLAWLAVSGKSRGALWNTQSGHRVYHVRGFSAISFPVDGSAYAEFPKFLETPQSLARLSLTSPDIQAKRTIEKDEHTDQVGPYLMTLVPPKHQGDLDHSLEMELRDIDSQHVLWTKQFAKESPSFYADPGTNSLTLFWPARSKAIGTLMKEDPEAAEQLRRVKGKEGISFVEILDLDSGKVRSRMCVDTARESFDIVSAVSSSEYLILADDQMRLLIFTRHGEPKGVVTGRLPVVSSATQLMAANTERGELVLYDLATLRQRAVYDFNSRVVFSGFSGDGKRLLVLTADQTVYLFDTAAKDNSQTIAAN